MKQRVLTIFVAMLTLGVAVPTWGAESLTDEFDAAKLNPKWKWWNEPKAWDLGKTQKNWLTIQADVSRNLWCSDDTTRLYQEVPDEPFDVETHLATQFQANSVVAGLVVKSSKDNNWVTLKWWGHGDGTAQLQFQTKCLEAGGGLTGRVPDFASQGGTADLYIRLTKEKDSYTAYWKLKSGDKWVPVGPHKFPLTPPLELGVYAGVDAAAGKLAAQYEFFRDNINPLLAVQPASKLALTWARLKQ